MKRLTAYSANITGSDAYWFKRRCELEAAFEQMKPTNDYTSLINCYKRHVCRPDGYCNSSKQSNNNDCRFGYPFKNENESKIIFTEKSNSKKLKLKKAEVKAEFIIKRNDPYLNVHNRLICHSWRAIVDMQIILDKNAAINYIYGQICNKRRKSSCATNRNIQNCDKYRKRRRKSSDQIEITSLKIICRKKRYWPIGSLSITHELNLFHSTFQYATQSLDFDTRAIKTAHEDENEPAISKSMLDYFANRYNENIVKPLNPKLIIYFILFAFL
jgi:hypothetical protein